MRPGVVVLGPTNPVEVRRVDPSKPEVAALIETHFRLMRGQSPAESCHVLPAEGLSEENIKLFALFEQEQVVAIGALKDCDGYHELKSMHTDARARGRGLARVLLQSLIDEARGQGATRVCLETGAHKDHQPARSLYQSEGFEICPPFGDYVADPLSVFMARDI